MLPRTITSRRRLNLQQLENRQLLAANCGMPAPEISTSSPGNAPAIESLSAESLSSESLSSESLSSDVSTQTRFTAPIDMSPVEQWMLELINQFRDDPLSARFNDLDALNEGLPPGTLSGSRLAPLAPQGILHQIAVAHSRDMSGRQFFSHVNPSGDDPSQRAIAAGYGGGVGENIALGGNGYINPDERKQQILASQAFHHLTDSPGHRANILGDYREVGVGFVLGEYSFPEGVYDAHFVTQVFGVSGSEAVLTGVAFEDLNEDDYYTVGEQSPGIKIVATDSRGDRFETVTGSSGGYAMALSEGTYHVLAFDPSRDAKIDFGQISIGQENVKLDIDSATFQGIGEPATPTPGMELDTNGDQKVSPLDALRIINALNDFYDDASNIDGEVPYDENLDVTGDGMVTVLDVLRVINHLGQRHAESQLATDESNSTSVSKSLSPQPTAILQGRMEDPDATDQVFSDLGELF